MISSPKLAIVWHKQTWSRSKRKRKRKSYSEYSPTFVLQLYVIYTRYRFLLINTGGNSEQFGPICNMTDGWKLGMDPTDSI
jgi:hypothetical protein